VAKGASKGAKLIRVPGELVSMLMEAANREGRTFYDYTVEALEQMLKAHEMKQSLKKMVEFYELMEIQRQARLALTPMDALNCLIARHYSEDKEALQQKWYESGEWYGKYLVVRLRDQDPVDVFKRLLAASRWDLDEVSVSKSDGAVQLRCVSFLLPLENTELLMRFLEGVMHSLGYEVRKRECMKGVITMEFEEREKGKEGEEAKAE